MTSERMALQDLRLLGGALCLDFVNSIENRAGHPPEDFLTSYPDLVRWGRHAGLITDATAARLIALAAADEPAAHEACSRRSNCVPRCTVSSSPSRRGDDRIQPIWNTCGAPMQTRCLAQPW